MYVVPNFQICSSSLVIVCMASSSLEHDSPVCPSLFSRIPIEERNRCDANSIIGLVHHLETMFSIIEVVLLVIVQRQHSTPGLLLAS